MYTKTFLSTLLAGLVAAAPAPVLPRQDGSYFSAIAIHSTSAVHLQQINANGGKFWVGKPTATYCPSISGLVCPAGNVTAFGAFDGALGLDTIVPGGQQAYIDTDGSLSFTVAHSAAIPTGAQTTPFTYTPGSTNTTVGSLTFGSNGEGFYACPSANETSVYQIFATTTSNADCIGISLATISFEGSAAWEYT